MEYTFKKAAIAALELRGIVPGDSICIDDSHGMVGADGYFNVEIDGIVKDGVADDHTMEVFTILVLGEEDKDWSHMGWKPIIGGTYFYVEIDGTVMERAHAGTLFDYTLITGGNAFRNKTPATLNIKKVLDSYGNPLKVDV